MRVVFDAYWWVHGPTSLRHVLRETVFAWSKAFPDDSIALVVRRRHLDAARASAPSHAQLMPSRARPQALLAAHATERVRAALNFDAISAQNFAPRSAGISSVYLHDVLFRTNPEWFTRSERAYFSFMTRWAPRADIVFTSSRAEAARIRQNAITRSVRAVGLGLSAELIHDPAVTAISGLIPEQFLLTVGRLNVRKNLERTILGALRSGTVSPEFPLVVVGAASGRSESLSSQIAAAVDSGSIRFLGHIDDSELRWLYQNTRLFLFLTLGEGFGMPPIEARYFGAPLLVSDLAVLRENLGSDSTFTDPYNVDAIADALREALRLQPQQPRTFGAGVLEHDWSATVAEMREALETAIHG